MDAVREVVFLGRDNTIDLELRADGVAADLAAVTRMTLSVGGVTVDSDVASSAFDWLEGDGKLILALGDQSLPSRVQRDCRLVVYDPTNTEGIVWVDDLILDVR